MSDGSGEEKVVQEIQDKRSRIDKAKEAHQRADKERADAISLTKASYQANLQDPVILDVIRVAKNLAAYHTKVAQDGVGYREGALNNNGMPSQEVYYLTSEKRCSELDRAAGLLEIVDYIDRMREVDASKTASESPDKQ